MQKDNPYLDFSALDETRDYYNVPSFNSLMDEIDDELLDKEEDELSKEPSDDINAEERTLKEECSNRDELATIAVASKTHDKKGDTFENIDFDAIEMSVYG